MTAIFATALGPILAANTVALSMFFQRTFSKVAELTGWFLLGVGVAAVFFVPSGRIWGKRHLFVGGCVLLIITSAWGGGSGTNYDSFLAARVFQGVATAPFESLVNAAVGDLYFVHQRGTRMAFTNLAVFGGAFFTPILVGRITHDIGWEWTFYFVAIFCGLCLPAIYFFCPETAYRRDASLNLDTLARASPDATKPEDGAQDGGHEDKETAIDSGPAAVPSRLSDTAETIVGGDVEQSRQTPRKTTWRESLALFNGRKTDESFWKLLLRPFPLFLQPAFLWACLIQGLLIGWTVFIGVIMAQLFLSTPLWWTEVQTGYAYTAAFIGAIIGFVIAGALSDWSARYMTKLNGGIYEPEFRIVLVIPQMILGCAGLFGYGITVDGLLYEKYHYAVPLTFFALEVAGMVIGAVASSLYIVDAYRKYPRVHDHTGTDLGLGDLAIEGFTCMIIFKNIFSFALTFKAFEWLITNRSKAAPMFNALGIVQIVVCLSSIPLCKLMTRDNGAFWANTDLP